MQLAAPTLLQWAPELQRQIRERVIGNRAILAQVLQKCPSVELLGADAGWYAVLRVPRIMSEDELVLAIAQQAGVRVQPGYFFDFAREGYLVAGLLVESRLMQEAAAQLSAVLERLFE